MVIPSPSILVPVGIFFLVLFMFFRMHTRRYYFVRHGETLLNAGHIKQGEEGELSEEGRAQAERVGKTLKPLHIAHIISSTYPRAKETTEIMNTHLNVPVVYSDLFAERRNPSVVIGKKTKDPDVVRIIDAIEYAYHPDDYRYADEENFLDLKQRARKCLELLARQGTRQTVVVTHHVFLKMLLAQMLYRDDLHASGFTKASFFNFSDNATVSICDYNPWKRFSKTHGWNVVSFNVQPEDLAKE